LHLPFIPLSLTVKMPISKQASPLLLIEFQDRIKNLKSQGEMDLEGK